MHYNFDEVVNRENTASFKYDMRESIFKNPDVIPLWVADMDFRTPPFILDALRRRMEHEILGYTYMPASFSRSAAEWIYKQHGWEIDPAWICFSPGVVPALNLLVLEFTRPGDKVIVQPPVYFPFYSSILNHKRILFNNPLQYEARKYTMDFSNLESKIDHKTKIFFLCSPHNPTGNVWSKDVLEKLATICLKNNIILVSDEIHADLVFRPYRHIPTGSISDEIAAHTITCMSPSKTFNLAGLSTAFLIIPDESLRTRYNTILDRIHVGAGNIFGFVALEAAYQYGELWLSQLLDYLKGNLNLLSEFIHKHIPEIQVIQPQATYLAWLNFMGLGLNQQDLNSLLIHQAGLGMSDGLLFGEEGRGFQRINIGCPRKILYEALLKLQRAVSKFINNK